MIGRLYTSVAVVFTFLLTSCGSGKKLEAAESELSDCHDKNVKLERNVHDLAAEIFNLTEQRKQVETDFASYRKESDKMQAKYAESYEILKAVHSILDQIDKKLEAALSDLEDRGMSVHYKRGLLFVSMEDQLIYQSGSSKLGKDGIDALSKIAGVINDYPDVKIIVVGNTDDVQFKNGSDNWSLSTERANSVVRALRDVYHIDPAKLTAAGRGRFNPVADNSTSEGRAKNRRIDIIFNPDLDKLWDEIDIDD
jgi:chemotaxis protein MotB